MSTISNKFFIQVLEDGSSLNGQLMASPTPSQAYRQGQFIPNWATTPSSRPLIYLTLQNKGQSITPDSGYTWSYNGSVITFSSTSTTATIGATTYSGYVSTGDTAGKFFKTTYNGMPALGIIGNLASSDNVNMDVIRFDGQKTLATNPIPFSAMINVTITQWTIGGYLGVLNFPNGNTITDDGQTISCTAILYNENGEVTLSSSDYEWYYEGTVARQGTGKTHQISDSDVLDYLVVRCDFYVMLSGTRTKVYSAYGSVDDQHDPEFMWIKYNGANGNSASLRAGENVTFSISVGKVDDDDDTPPDTSWTSFKVKFLKSDGTVATSTSSSHNDSAFKISPDSGGYRSLPVSSGVATAKVYYDDVYDLCYKGLTGIIQASTSNT